MMKIKCFVIGSLDNNTFVVWDDETRDAIVIDPADESVALLDFINSEVLQLNKIVLTHAHGDHIGGVAWLQSKFPGLELALGKDDEQLLHDSESNFSKFLLGRKFEYKDVSLLSDGDIIEFGGVRLNVLTTPGHTQGGISLYGDGVLFSGDTLFRADIGRTDLPGGDFGKIISSIRNKLFALPDDTVVYTGHYQETTIGYEKKNNPYV